MTQPRRRDRTRPVELVVFSAILAAFTGLVVLMSTRQLPLAVIFAGIAFIVALVMFAMLALAAKPDTVEQHDLEEDEAVDRARDDLPPAPPTAPGDRPRGH